MNHTDMQALMDPLHRKNFLQHKAAVRRALMQANAGIAACDWIEADDAMLDQVTEWLYDLAKRGGFVKEPRQAVENTAPARSAPSVNGARPPVLRAVPPSRSGDLTTEQALDVIENMLGSPDHSSPMP